MQPMSLFLRVGCSQSGEMLAPGEGKEKKGNRKNRKGIAAAVRSSCSLTDQSSFHELAHSQ